MRLLTRLRNTRLVMEGTSTPVVRRSTVTAILGLASLRKERIRARTLSTLPVISVVYLAVFGGKSLFDGAHHNIRVGICCGEDERFASTGRVRINVVRQFL